MRALIVTNMYPSPERPAFGSFVRDQVEALRRIDGLEVELFTFSGGGIAAYARAAREIAVLHGSAAFDVVHAHYGLTAWPARRAGGRCHVVTLHGTDLADPRSRAITAAALRSMDLVATVSESLRDGIPRWARPRRTAVLPCGVDTRRFKPIPRETARGQLGLDPEGPYLLFPADPARPEKRHDLARRVAGSVPLLTLGGIDPREVPLWVNAANAVLVPSDREGFGLGVLEALACEVPVLATPVGVSPEALAALPGTVCTPFSAESWGEALEPILADPDPRVDGRARAEAYSVDAMADRVLGAWKSLLDRT